MIQTAALVTVSVGVLAIAASSIVVAYVQYTRHILSEPSYIRRERLHAYGEIMEAAISVNRLAIELMEEDRFQVEFERYTMEKESEFTEPVEDVTEALQRNYHVVDPAVKDAVNEYLNFLSRYPRGDIHPGELLSLTSQIVVEMRADLDLPKLFSHVEETGTQPSHKTDATATGETSPSD